MVRKLVEGAGDRGFLDRTLEVEPANGGKEHTETDKREA